MAPVPERALRAIQLIRVSKRGKRSADKFVSPEDQIRLMNIVCEQQKFVTVATYREINQSGLRTPFDKRKGLYPATQMIENGEADVVVMAFRDRMARNIVVEQEFQGRIGKAGGKIWTHDSGEIRLDTAVERFTSGVLGLMAMMQAEQVGEKTQGPKERAMQMGVAPYAELPLGYRRHCDLEGGCHCEGRDPRHVVIYEPERAMVKHVFAMREARASLEEIRDWLREQGIHRQIRGVQSMLKNEFYLGIMRFGKLENRDEARAIIEPAVFRSVQKLRVARGPRRKDRGDLALLARLGIVRCGSCNRAMTVGVQTSNNGTDYAHDYRCPSMGDCTARAAISARLLDSAVSDYMKQAEAQGRASIGERVLEAEAMVEATRKALARHLLLAGDSDDLDEVLAKKNELREAHEAAKERLQAIRLTLGSAETVSLERFDEASLDRKRRLIRILIKRIVIAKLDRHGGRAKLDRIDIQPFDQ